MIHETLLRSSSITLIQKWMEETHFSSQSQLGKQV